MTIKNLSLKGMQKEMFGKSINDLGWYEFVRQLSYKSKWHRSSLHKVNIDSFHQASHAVVVTLKIQL